jgi:outer membrane assembly lipoprotein YfiO
MKQNRWHFWYCTIIIAITPAFLANANLDSYSISTGGAANQQSPLDATIDSFKSGAARALKVTKADEPVAAAPVEQALSTKPFKKKGWVRTKIDQWMDPKNKKKTLRNMNYAELEAFKQRCLDANDRYNAIRTLERMVPICTDLEKLKGTLLELADLLFDDGKLEAAGKMYREFVKYYPGNEKVEYALYKAVVCKFYVILDAERDQTSTQDAIDLASKFLEREEIFITYSKEVRTMRAQCYQRLFDSEVSIFNFYCNRGRYKSAQTRLANIRKDFIEIIPHCNPFLITLEIGLAELVKDTATLETKKLELAQKFPDYQKTTLAQAIAPINVKKKSNVDRF